jgi:hypothetical protein
LDPPLYTKLIPGILVNNLQGRIGRTVFLTVKESGAEDASPADDFFLSPEWLRYLEKSLIPRRLWKLECERLVMKPISRALSL